MPTRDCISSIAIERDCTVTAHDSKDPFQGKSNAQISSTLRGWPIAGRVRCLPSGDHDSNDRHVRLWHRRQQLHHADECHQRGRDATFHQPGATRLSELRSMCDGCRSGASGSPHPGVGELEICLRIEWHDLRQQYDVMHQHFRNNGCRSKSCIRSIHHRNRHISLQSCNLQS